MGVLLLKCPRVGKAFSTGIHVERDALAALPEILTRSKCPHCGSDHFWWTREAILMDAVPPADGPEGRH
jgi:hypothetical protein